MIVVFGSNVLDIFLETPDLPPKDQAMFLDGHHERPGGKGANQAVAAVKGGSEVKFYGALGTGGHGRQMYDALQEHGVDASGIEFLNMPSGLATIFVDESDGTHKVVVSQGANLKAKHDMVPDDAFGKSDTLLVQGELPILETEKVIQRAKKAGCRTVLNFAPATQNLTEGILESLDVLIMNEHEANLVGQAYSIDTSNKAQFAQDLANKFQLIPIVTMGPDGSLAYVDNSHLHVTSLKVKATDTIGAGDAHAGYFCSALDQGISFENALVRASIAGSLTCTKIGAQAALPELEDVLKHVDDIQVSANLSNSSIKSMVCAI